MYRRILSSTVFIAVAAGQLAAAERDYPIRPVPLTAVNGVQTR
jgi:hypothetical protein